MISTTSRRNENKSDYKRWKKETKLPIKICEPKNSLMTDLLSKDENLKSIYYLGVAVFITTVLSTAATDYINEGRVYLSSRITTTAFKNFSYAILLWIPIFLSSLIVYFCFMLWDKVRRFMKNQTKMWDLLWLTLFILYYLGLLYLSAKAVLFYDLGIASSIAVMTETIRLLMKNYAFVRANCSKYLQQPEELQHPTFSHYLYFSFAPVAIYKDVYPRSNHPIRWGFIGRCAFEFFCAFLFYGIVYEKTFCLGLRDYGIKPYTWIDITTAILNNFYAGFILLLLFFYAALHLYCNIAAELTRFSDRLFYKDWWTANTPDQCLRKWNVFVHNWLYTYIYKDFYEYVIPNKTLAKFMVFFMSALFHDLVICVSARLFIPITAIMFMVPAVMMETVKMNKHVFRVLLWMNFGLSISLNFTILSVEYFARINCPLNDESIYNIIKPRFLYC
ncbi:hypothetical protein FQR65_LT06401 [Abscondita terminalis]|nr:hypothetical protein FQR65_LT06401 [Abscondita terminalis]